MAKKKTSKIHLVVVLTLLIIVAFFGYRYFTSQEKQRAEAGLFPIIGTLAKAGCVYFDIDGGAHTQAATNVSVMALLTGDKPLSRISDHNPYLDTFMVALFGHDILFYFGNLSLDRLKELAKLHPGVAATAKESEDVLAVLKLIFPFQIDDLGQVTANYEQKYAELEKAQQHNIKTIKTGYIGGSTYKDLKNQMANIKRILKEIADQIAFLQEEEARFLALLETDDIPCSELGIDVS